MAYENRSDPCGLLVRLGTVKRDGTKHEEGIRESNCNRDSKDLRGSSERCLVYEKNN